MEPFFYYPLVYCVAIIPLAPGQVMIEAASSEDQQTPEYRTRKLESLTRQNELIEEENRKREEAKKAQVRMLASLMVYQVVS